MSNAKHETIADIVDEINREFERLRAENARLRAAVKPLLDYSFGDYQPPWKTLRINGERIDGAATTADGYAFSLVDECNFGVAAMIEMANLIGALQKTLNPLKEEEVDCG